jgi:hypothetical protein
MTDRVQFENKSQAAESTAIGSRLTATTVHYPKGLPETADLFYFIKFFSKKRRHKVAPGKHLRAGRLRIFGKWKRRNWLFLPAPVSVQKAA